MWFSIGRHSFSENCLTGISRWFGVTDLTRISDTLAGSHSSRLVLSNKEIRSLPKGFRLTNDQRFRGEASPGERLHVKPSQADETLRFLFHNKSWFRQSLAQNTERGGAFQRGVEIVQRIIRDELQLSSFAIREDERIANSEIYEINQVIKLCCVRHENHMYLCFLGDTHEVEEWLSNNRGLTFVVNGSSRRIEPTTISRAGSIPDLRADTSLTADNEPYLKRLRSLNLNDFIKSKIVTQHLLDLNEDNSLDDVLDALDDETIHPTIRDMLLDVFAKVMAEDVDAAQARVDIFNGTSCPAVDAPSCEKAGLSGLINTDVIADLGSLSEADLEKLFDPGAFQDWMLFLHPDQKALVEVESEIPVVLTGVSGSGKTCVLVHRARHLAQLYPDDRIGIITLNRTLTRLIHNLVFQLCSAQESSRIEVIAFYDYFQKVLREIGASDYLGEYAKCFDEMALVQKTLRRMDPFKFANDFDASSGETLDDTWREFLEQSHVWESRNRIYNYLREYVQDPEEYVKEEFTLLRSALLIRNRRDAYRDFERTGRCIPLRQVQRDDMVQFLEWYEEYMFAGHMLDEMGLTQALINSRVSRIASLPDEMRFRCLLIDEFQDFSTLDLRLLREVPTDEANGLFLAGDTVQKVFAKSLKISGAGLGRGSAKHEQIRKNYRNSRQILEAANLLVLKYGKQAKAQGEETDLLDPELATRSTALPLVYRADHEVSKAWRLAEEWIAGAKFNPYAVCIASAAPWHISVGDILDATPDGIQADRLSGDYILNPERLVVGTISDVKGFEFGMIIIVGLSQGTFPGPHTPKDERWREAFRLYVAMTRGRDQVALIYNGEPSEFLMDMGDCLSWRT